MISKKILLLLVFIVGISYVTSPLNAENKDKNSSAKSLRKVNGDPIRTYLDINNLSTVFKNDGISDIDKDEKNSGLVYPKGSGKTACFESGFIWGCYIGNDPQVRVGGSTYRSSMKPGKILSPGVAESPDLPKNRIYRIRPDVYPGGPKVDLSMEATNENSSVAAVRAQYEKDWTEWPATDGAPYTDKNNNGKYDPDVDIPGVPGANQTIWYVCNDVDAQQSVYLYGTNPCGIELQVTVWAYSQTGALGNMFFRKYKMINKGKDPLKDVIVSYWADVDLGNSTDDFSGCDTTLSLGYCYNANASDATYSPLPPPATGFDFFQGPLIKGVQGQDLNKNGVDDADDYGITNGQKVGPGYINLPMTSFYYFARGDASVTDPTLGSTDGATQFYNFMQGKVGKTGKFFVDPNTGKNTTFVVPGDPQTGTGWLDGQVIPADDRRQGQASGPFQMAVGDTQEIVVAEIVAGAIPGMDRLSAVGLLKFYDKQAQLVYDNNFDLPVAPPAPEVSVSALDKEIVLDWGSNLSKVQATESSNNKGYKFQGYNVYQLPSATASVSEGKRLQTYDIIDGVTKIKDSNFDATTGEVVNIAVQFGNDVGIQRYLDIKTDAIKGGTPLINGIKYYFAVTAYSYNSDPNAVPNNLENPLNIITIIPHSADPGISIPTKTGDYKGITHTGLADGSVDVNIVDPAKVTGHAYQVYFSQRQEVRNENGDWVASASKRINNYKGIKNVDTLTGSSIDVTASYGPQSGTYVLNFTLTNSAPDENGIDGIKLTFPDNVTIESCPGFTTYYNGVDITPSIQGHSIILGDVSGAQSKSGSFGDGDFWTATIKAPGIPIPVDWYLYDDGASGGAVDVSGTTTITAVGKFSRLAKYWNLKDSTTQQVKLVNQSVINGKDLYPLRDDIQTSLGTSSATIVDGLQLNLNVGYAAPIEFFSTDLTPGPNSKTQLTNSGSTSTLDFENYTIYGTATSTALEGFGFGTDDVNELQKDYILKFTGVWDSTVKNGQKIYFIKSGGQLATIFKAADLSTHPLNPNPGTNKPFLIRIPFEVWSKDDNRQVNLMFRDRMQTETDNPFYSWLPTNRNYVILVNSAYDSLNPIATTSDAANAATWVLVMYGTNYSLGDQVTISYANPIQIGKDVYTFKTNASSYSKTLAKEAVNKINVFPNPYYGTNSEELNKYNRFVTFSHLPNKATIRIFNLAGVLVKTINHDALSQFERWDLANNSGLPVASGLYIAYIDIPDLGTSKILKIAIIQEQQILDRF